MEYQVNNNFYHDYSSVDFNDKLNEYIDNKTLISKFSKKSIKQDMPESSN